MARGMKTGGRTAGTPNRATLQKQMIREVLESSEGRALMAENMRAMQQAPKGGKKAVDVLRELMLLSHTLVGMNQPRRDAAGELIVENADRLQQYLAIAVRASSELARFESPTFKAIAVQEVPPPPAAHADGDAKVIGSIRKRSQQDAAAVYMRLVRGGKAA